MSRDFRHVMIDIETLDTTLHSIILQIAAVKFNFSNDRVETFYQNVTPSSCKAIGLTQSDDTVRWWAKQPMEAQKAVMIDQVPIKDALLGLSRFIAPMDKYSMFWAQGIGFDYGNLQTALEALDMPHPWKYYQQMDSRTIFKMCNLDFNNYPRVGNHHNALDDCMTQISALKELFHDD